MFGNSRTGVSKYRDRNFVPLQAATFCAECELISTNSTPHCLACGSRALLSLSRVLGGSLRNRQTAHLITDVELDQLVRDLLRMVPDPELLSAASHSLGYRLRPLAASCAWRMLRTQRLGFALFRRRKKPSFILPNSILSRPSAPSPSVRSILRERPARRLCCVVATKSSAAHESAAQHQIWEFACKPMLASRRKPSAPGRSCYATMPSAIRVWILPAAGAWESAPSSFPPCATTGAPWGFSKCFRHPRVLLTTGTWLLCSCFRASWWLLFPVSPACIRLVLRAFPDNAATAAN